MKRTGLILVNPPSGFNESVVFNTKGIHRYQYVFSNKARIRFYIPLTSNSLIGHRVSSCS
ncbi:MAG: hypothetical protein QXP02_01605 [Desulfurococcaceae archaeon]